MLAIAPGENDAQTLVVTITSTANNAAQTTTGNGTLTYTLAGDNGNFSEQIKIADLVTVYDMFDAADRLRLIAGLDPPDLDPTVLLRCVVSSPMSTPASESQKERSIRRSCSARCPSRTVGPSSPS